MFFFGQREDVFGAVGADFPGVAGFMEGAGGWCRDYVAAFAARLS